MDYYLLQKLHFILAKERRYKMYKLKDGRLITPPKVWKGFIGYDKSLEKLVADGWKPLIEVGKGELFKYIEKKDCIEKSFYNKPFDYREERAKAFPPVGDVVDAICKAFEGDDSELQVIITQRQIIKSNIKKQ